MKKIENKYKSPFILRMSLDLFLNLEKAKDKAFMMAIYSFSNNGQGTCYAGLSKIAERAGMSVGLAHQLKKKYINKGYLRKIGQKKTLGGCVDEVKISVQYVNPRFQNTSKKFSSDETKHLNKTIKLKHNDVYESNKKEIDAMVEWAYTRADNTPSCSREAFVGSVLKAINNSSFDRVYSCFVKEESAIAFLTNIKHLYS